jgi:ribonuclease BN (tRNA processing enzyme)
MRLTVLGCAGTFPSAHSGCSSYLVEHDGFRLLLDVGNGSIGALQQACGLLGPDAAVVSHLHGDHFLDLVTYTYARRYHPDGAAPRLPLYGPSEIRAGLNSAYARDAAELLDAVYDFRPVTANATLEIGPFAVELARVNHPVETYGMRVSAGGRTLAYSADTAATEELIRLASGADLFLCEASYQDGDDNPPDIHLTGREAAEHADRAGVGHLLLTHLVSWNDEGRTLSEARGVFSGEIGVARPLESYDL